MQAQREAEGWRYALFCLTHVFKGFLATRRYWRILLANRKIRHLLGWRLFSVLLGFSIFAGIQTVNILVLGPKYLNQWWAFLPCLVFLLIGAIMGLMIVTSIWSGMVHKNHPWVKYREVLLRAAWRSMLKPMGVRIRLNRLEDVDPLVDRTYGLFDWDEWGGSMYLPEQSRYVINIVMDGLYSSDPNQYQVLKYYTTTFDTPGSKLIFARAYQYHVFMRERQPAQPGFGGMFLQQGKAAEILYQQVSADQYAELSFYGVAVADMPTVKNTPLFLLKEVYTPDAQVMSKMETRLRIDDAKWWIKYYRETELTYHLRLRPHLIVEHERFAAQDPKMMLP